MRLTEEQIKEALSGQTAEAKQNGTPEAPARPRMEEIHPRMSAEDKQRVLDEIMRVLRGGDGDGDGDAE